VRLIVVGLLLEHLPAFSSQLLLLIGLQLTFVPLRVQDLGSVVSGHGPVSLPLCFFLLKAQTTLTPVSLFGVLRLLPLVNEVWVFAHLDLPDRREPITGLLLEISLRFRLCLQQFNLLLEKLLFVFSFVLCLDRCQSISLADHLPQVLI